MITLENLKETELTMERLDDRCEEIISWKNSHDPKGLVWRQPLGGYLHDFEFNSEDETLSFAITQMAGLCDGESEGMSIPYHELINDDWKEAFVQQVQKKQEEIDENNKIMKTEAAEEHEKWERDMYEKLKMKFEGDGK